jgi:hypothetical protein
MNEKIKELAEQAGIEVWGGARYVYHPSETLDSTVVTKFADSIVWECMKICEDVMKKDNSALACWSEIKRTFRS